MAQCEHPRPVLGKLECGAGGTQFRRYCSLCWRAVGGPLPHASIPEADRATLPTFDRDVLERAQDQAWRRYRATGTYDRD